MFMRFTLRSRGANMSVNRLIIECNNRNVLEVDFFKKFELVY